MNRSLSNCRFPEVHSSSRLRLFPVLAVSVLLTSNQNILENMAGLFLHEAGIGPQRPLWCWHQFSLLTYAPWDEEGWATALKPCHNWNLQRCEILWKSLYIGYIFQEHHRIAHLDQGCTWKWGAQPDRETSTWARLVPHIYCKTSSNAGGCS